MAARPATREEAAARATARVVERWPVVPFWQRRRADLVTHLALPGAAISGGATICSLLFEPALHWPAYDQLPFAFLGGDLWMALLSMNAAVLSFGVVDRDRSRHPFRRGWGWLGLLPVVGLLVVARDLAARDRDPGPPAAGGAPGVQLGRRPRLRAPLFPSVIGAALPRYQGGMLWVATLFGFHLAWLFGAMARLAQRGGVSFAAGLACLHLLAMAGAWLMMGEEERRRSLLPFRRTDRLVPWLLLLPMPLNTLAVLAWLRPKSTAARDSLAAFAFGRDTPVRRLAAFRRTHAAQASFQGFLHQWSSDPLRPLAEQRRRREERWAIPHLIALGFQSAFLCRCFTLRVRALWEPLNQLFLTMTGILVLAFFIELILQFGAEPISVSRWKTAICRSPGVALAVAMGIAAASCLEGAPRRGVGRLGDLLVLAAFVLLFRLGFELLVAREGLRRIPASLVGAITFALASLGLELSLFAVEARQLAEAFETAAAASILLSPFLVWLAARLAAPGPAASPWLALPLSALGWPFLHEKRRTREGPAPDDVAAARAGRDS